MNEQVYVHSIDPFAIQITESFGIRWYGLSYLAGFVAGYLIIRWLASRKLSPLGVERAADFVFSVAIGTIVGGRLGYCLFYSPELLTRFRGSFPFWGVLAVNEGGMASHGGIAGIVVASFLFARKHGVSWGHLCDLTTLGGSVGIFFGRIANFINAELVGRPVASAVSWAVKFPADIVLWPAKEPERLGTLTAAAAQIGIAPETWDRWVAAGTGSPEAWRAIEGALHRIADAAQQGHAGVIAALGPVLTARHPSQLYEALLEGLLVFLALFFIWRRPRKPGVITGWFLTIYSLVRVVGEQFRMPDAHIGYQIFGLTRGQILSFVMLLIGLAVLKISSARPVPAIGGWGRRE